MNTFQFIVRSITVTLILFVAYLNFREGKPWMVAWEFFLIAVYLGICLWVDRHPF